MRVKGEAIEADISMIKRQHIRGVFQQGLLDLCQVKVILASSLRVEHSWWIFVSDITLLMQ